MSKLQGKVMASVIAMALPTMGLAVDLDAGAKVFAANCAQCHAGGKNLVIPSKTLKKEALEKYGMYSPEAIINQVTRGKNAMPAFGARLKPDQIESVAAYVLDRAANDWRR